MPVSTSETFTRTLRQEPHALEGGAVLAQRHLVLRAAVEEVEDRARQAAFREDAQVFDVDGSGKVRHSYNWTSL